MEENRMTGRVTIPTDLDVVPETLQILKKWGADAIRDCDGTDFPQELKSADAKIYSTYYTTRKDNAWAKANPDEVQQCYIMTGFYTAPGDTVTIPLMKGISPELMQVNTNDDITRWWEVMDRTTGQPVPPEQWSYDDGSVTVQAVPRQPHPQSKCTGGQKGLAASPAPRPTSTRPHGARRSWKSAHKDRVQWCRGQNGIRRNRGCGCRC